MSEVVHIFVCGHYVPFERYATLKPSKLYQTDKWKFEYDMSSVSVSFNSSGFESYPISQFIICEHKVYLSKMPRNSTA